MMRATSALLFVAAIGLAPLPSSAAQPVKSAVPADVARYCSAVAEYNHSGSQGLGTCMMEELSKRTLTRLDITYDGSAYCSEKADRADDASNAPFKEKLFEVLHDLDQCAKWESTAKANANFRAAAYPDATLKFCSVHQKVDTKSLGWGGFEKCLEDHSDAWRDPPGVPRVDLY